MKINIESLIHDIFKKVYSNDKEVNIIAIDGLGRVGKSTLANKFLQYDTNIQILHMDDFYLPSIDRIDLSPEEKDIGADFDWKRIIEEVLKPQKSNKVSKY